MRFPLVVVLLLVLGCTTDFEKYRFDATGTGGAGGTSGVVAGTGGASTAATMAAGTGGASATSGTTAAAGGGTPATTAATTAQGSGGGGSSPVGSVECGGACDVSTTGFCCIGAISMCYVNGTCPVGATKIRCDGPEDCPGKICCGILAGTWAPIDCANSCGGADHYVFCHDDIDCTTGGKTCKAAMSLPAGYETCQ